LKHFSDGSAGGGVIARLAPLVIAAVMIAYALIIMFMVAADFLRTSRITAAVGG
jgi:hypothetical protein